MTSKKIPLQNKGIMTACLRPNLIKNGSNNKHQENIGNLVKAPVFRRSKRI